jgi:uncharacterized protein YraI
MQKISLASVAFTTLVIGTQSPRAEVVCGLNPLNNEYLSVRSGGGTQFIELMRLAPNARVVVSPQQQGCTQQPGWLRIAIPSSNTPGCVARQFICPGTGVPRPF